MGEMFLSIRTANSLCTKISSCSQNSSRFGHWCHTYCWCMHFLFACLVVDHQCGRLNSRYQAFPAIIYILQKNAASGHFLHNYSPISSLTTPAYKRLSFSLNKQQRNKHKKLLEECSLKMNFTVLFTAKDSRHACSPLEGNSS